MKELFSTMNNMLIELESTLMKKFMNIDIQNYSYGDFKELFYLIEELVNKSFAPCSYVISNTSLNSGHIHIILKDISNQYAFGNTLSVLLSIQKFIITDIEISLLH